jgi:hypothetical protein
MSGSPYSVPGVTSYVPGDWAARNSRAFGVRQTGQPHASAETAQPHRHRDVERDLARHDRAYSEHDQRLSALEDKLADVEDARQDDTGHPAPAGGNSEGGGE